MTMAKASKKAAPKKSASGKSSATGIKYEDKSPGQPDLIPIFNELKKLMAPYEKGNLRMRGGEGGQVVLLSEKPVVIDGRKKDALWFVSALIQKGYVGFYYMPVYMNEPVRRQLKPELLKCLKGKACFHIKKQDPVIFHQIEEALQIGCNDYERRGWI